MLKSNKAHYYYFLFPISRLSFIQNDVFKCVANTATTNNVMYLTLNYLSL